MTAYYNEIDPKAAAWLRELIKQGLIAYGVVDERSIEDVRPDELTGFAQWHFFAGIGAWSYALRRAGWPDDRPVWTGSCPCQPFSAAGKGGGFADERHLWPAWFHLISPRGPGVVFGEQVASKDGLTWLDVVHADMEGAGYTFGAADLCSAGVGAPHIRQRLYFVGDSDSIRRCDNTGRSASDKTAQEIGRTIRNEWLWNEPVSSDCGIPDNVADSVNERCEGDSARTEPDRINESARCCAPGDVADRESIGPYGRSADETGALTSEEFKRFNSAMRVEHAAGVGREQWRPESGERGAIGGCSSSSSSERPGPTNGRWAYADWLGCTDGKWRPVEPGTFPLAYGAPARVGRLRGYGNAINAALAEEFIRAYTQAVGLK